MSQGYNSVELIGNLGRDPEIFHTSAGQSKCSYSIACSESWKDAAGDKQEKTEWVNIVV